MAEGPSELTGRQVRIRTVEESDLPTIASWYDDPELASPFDRYAIDTLEGLRAAVTSAPEDPSSLAPRFAIERRESRALVGCLGHYRAHPVLTLLDIWYLVGDRSARGSGIGSEAVGLLVGHLFRTTAVERVGATSDVANPGSFRLLERLGFQREGTLRSSLYHHAGWHDVAVYGITRAEWARRPRPA